MSKKKKIAFGTVGALLVAAVLWCVGYLNDYYKADVPAVESYEVLNEVSKKVLEDGTLSIAGQILTTEEFELRLVLKDGLNGQALPDNTAVVQLDTTLYPDLEKEGIARDFVRMIQQARKEADFDVSDRITVIYTVNTPLLVEAIKEHSDYIADQVLAVAMRAEETAVSGAKTEELGDGQVAFVVER